MVNLGMLLPREAGGGEVSGHLLGLRSCHLHGDKFWLRFRCDYRVSRRQETILS
jgi:hypothetical protein